MIVVSPDSLKLGAAWHGDDAVEELHVPYMILLEVAQALLESSRLLPVKHRSIQNMQVGYWRLES